MTDLCKGLILYGAIISIFISCKKDPEKMVTIKVVEYKTNMPIAGASVELFKPGDYMPSCNCWTNVSFLKKQTDANGFCTVSETDFSHAYNGISISKENYWQIPRSTFSIQTEYSMDLMTPVELHLIKTKTYPEKISMFIFCNGERAVSIGAGSTLFPSPLDSTFNFQAYGGQTNSFSWQILDSNYAVIDSGGPLQKDIARSGITKMEIKY